MYNFLIVQKELSDETPNAFVSFSAAPAVHWWLAQKCMFENWTLKNRSD